MRGRLPRNRAARNAGRPIGRVIGLSAVVAHIVKGRRWNRRAGIERNRKRADAAIGVGIEQGVLVVPEARAEVGHLYAEYQSSVVGNVDVDECDRRIEILPRLDAELLPLGRVRHRAGKNVGRVFIDGKTAIRRIVIVVASGGVVGRDVVPLDEIKGAGVQRGIDVLIAHLKTLIDDESVRVIREGIWKCTGRGIHFRARAEDNLVSVKSGPVGVVTSHTQKIACAGILAGSANAGFICGGEGVFEPGHADLLESAALQSVHVLGDDRVLTRLRDPEEGSVANVARDRAEGVAGDAPDAPPARDYLEFADDDVRARGRCELTGAKEHKRPDPNARGQSIKHFPTSESKDTYRIPGTGTKQPKRGRKHAPPPFLCPQARRLCVCKKRRWHEGGLPPRL